MNRKTAIVLAAAIGVASVVLGGAAIAGGVAFQWKQGESDGAAQLAPISQSGKGQTGTKIVTEVDAQTTSSTVFVNLPGASTPITVPHGQRALILVRFSGESFCNGGADGNWCSARILVGGVEARPAAGTNYAFESDPVDNDFWEGHAMERVSGTLGPGTYTVRVQWAVTDALTTFALDDWTLVVERIKK